MMLASERRKWLPAAVFGLYLDWARTRIWLIPSTLCVLALLLALATLAFDRRTDIALPMFLAWELDSSVVRQLMGVMATSVLSSGGVSFSVTMVALTLTSGQYGPKIMRHFLSDTRSKLSLGLFFATAIYALTIFLALETDDRPAFSALTSMTLMIVALLEFIRFIHRTASDLQADQIIERVGKELRKNMHDLVSEVATEHSCDDTLNWRRAARQRTQTSLQGRREGYVQAIDYDRLVALLREEDSVAMVRIKPGDFMIPGLEMLRVWRIGTLDEGPDANDVNEKLRNCVTVGRIRTPIQDPEFPITQLQQIGARALSSGINDPGTAITCVDWLSVALAEIVDKPLPGRIRSDASGESRLLVSRPSFASIVDSVYAPLRQMVADDVQVSRRLFDSLQRLCSLTQRLDRQETLEQQALQLHERLAGGAFIDHDRRLLRRCYVRVRRRLHSARATA